MQMRYVVGLISDTHGVFDNAAAEALKHTDLVIHAGDVGHHGRHREVLNLYAEATATQLLAVAGNVDDELNAADRQLLPQHRLVQAAGWQLLVCHIVAPGPTAKVDAAAAALIQQLQPDIVVCGHSHKACCWQADGVCYVNPGSAGPARFKLPRTVALLELPYKTSAAGAAPAGRSCQPAGGTSIKHITQPAQGAAGLQTGQGACNAAPGRVTRSRARTAGGVPAGQHATASRSTSASGGQGGAEAVAAGEAAAAAGEQSCSSSTCHASQWLGELRVRFVQLPRKAPPRLTAAAGGA